MLMNSIGVSVPKRSYLDMTVPKISVFGSSTGPRRESPHTYFEPLVPKLHWHVGSTGSARTNCGIVHAAETWISKEVEKSEEKYIFGD